MLPRPNRPIIPLSSCCAVFMPNLVPGGGFRRGWLSRLLRQLAGFRARLDIPLGCLRTRLATTAVDSGGDGGNAERNSRISFPVKLLQWRHDFFISRLPPKGCIGADGGHRGEQLRVLCQLTHHFRAILLILSLSPTAVRSSSVLVVIPSNVRGEADGWIPQSDPTHFVHLVTQAPLFRVLLRV